MSFSDERAAIESRFSANWTTTDIKRDGVPFTQPDNDTAWVAITVENASEEETTIGSNARHVFRGNIIVQVFTPPHAGSDLARQYADTIATIWRRQEFSSGSSGTIWCRTPGIRVIGETDGWYQINVVTEYERHVTY